MKTETEGKPVRKAPGRIFQRKGSAFLWCAYYLRGKEYRESTHETDPQKAEKFLKRRLKAVGADQIGAAPFITPRQERVRISELLDALQDDYGLRGKDSKQFRSNLKYVRLAFGDWRARHSQPKRWTSTSKNSSRKSRSRQRSIAALSY